MGLYSERIGQPRNRHEKRAYQAALAKDNKTFPTHLVQIDFGTTNLSDAAVQNGIIEAWRSRDFLVQIYDKPEFSATRMSVNRTSVKGERWADGISWDDLQRLKRECGRGHLEAVEIYPSDDDVTNVANMRHLWILKNQSKMAFGFGREPSASQRSLASQVASNLCPS